MSLLGVLVSENRRLEEVCVERDRLLRMALTVLGPVTTKASAAAYDEILEHIHRSEKAEREHSHPRASSS